MRGGEGMRARKGDGGSFPGFDIGRIGFGRRGFEGWWRTEDTTIYEFYESGGILGKEGCDFTCGARRDGVEIEVVEGCCSGWWGGG